MSTVYCPAPIAVAFFLDKNGNERAVLRGNCKQRRYIMKQRWKIGPVVMFAIGMLTNATAWGKDCGRRVICECGDTLVEDYKLPADLGPCPGNGLNLGDDVFLDGNHHHIFGSQTIDTFGVVFRGRGAEVKNLEVSNFARCARFRGAPEKLSIDNVLRDSELHDCGFLENGQPARRSSYGVDFAQEAKGNVVKNTWIHNAFDEGVHFGSGSEGNRIIENTIENNFDEQVYLLNTTRNVVFANLISGGRVSVFVDGASANTVRENLGDRLLQVRAGAANNKFKDNTFRSVRFEQNATANEVKDGQIIGGNPCIQLRTGATANVLRGVELVDCVSDVDARELGTNTLRDVNPLRPDKISVRDLAVVIVCNEGPNKCQKFTAP